MSWHNGGVPTLFTETVSGTTNRPLQLFVPHLANPDVPHRLICYHGGAGLRGNDGYIHIQSELGLDITNHLDTFPHFALFVQGMTSLGGGDPTNLHITLRSIIQAIGYVQGWYNINPKKIDWLGFSTGGTYAWQLAYLYPAIFASIVSGDGTMLATNFTAGNSSTPDSTPYMNPAVFSTQALVDAELSRVIGPSQTRFLQTRSNNYSTANENDPAAWGVELNAMFAQLNTDGYPFTRHDSASTAAPLTPVGTSERLSYNYRSAEVHAGMTKYVSWNGATNPLWDWITAGARP